jgi:HK97 family phage major capsid protein
MEEKTMNIKVLRQRKADLLTANRDLIDLASKEGNRPLTEAEDKVFDTNAEAVKATNADIDRVEALMDEERKIGRSLDSNYSVPAKPEGFKSLGEQLLAVVRHSRSGGHDADPRLYAVGTGAGEQIPSEGGFLLQYDFAAGLLKRTYEVGNILSRVQKVPISGNSNGLKINTIYETTRATGSRYGGVRAYRLEEAGAAIAFTPKFGRLELNLKKIIGLYYATDELLQDAAALEAVVSQAVPEEIAFKVEDEIIRGTGGGQMLGIMKAACKVAVAKEVGQTAATITSDNIVKMWARLWGRSQQNAIWLVNQDTFPQLYIMGITVGVGGAPIYMPPGGLSGSPYSTLFGRPVLPVEYCETLGTEGDIILADLSQYLIIEKGGLQTASSMHVQFLTDQMVFRFILRNDGLPLWPAPLTPYKGTNTLSPFITLAVRA